MDSEFARDRVSKLLLKVALNLGIIFCKNFNSLILDLVYLKDN